MAEVGRDNEKVGRVRQVFAEQFPIFVLLVFAQSAHEDGDDAEVVLTAAKTDELASTRREGPKDAPRRVVTAVTSTERNESSRERSEVSAWTRRYLSMALAV